MRDSDVCVLGAGITGTLTACMLQDAGVDVLLVDQAPEVMTGASRWNEGKIHLGYTYTGTASLASAALMLSGAGIFEEAVERVTGLDLEENWYSEPVIYLVETSTIIPAEELWEEV